MAWSTPTSVTTGNIITQSWTEVVRDDLLYLYDRSDNPTRARVYHNTTQSLSTGVDTALAMNAETTDSATVHDTATNNSRLTIPSGQGGFYAIVAYCEWAANATGQRKLLIRADGTTTLEQVVVDAAASGATRLTVVALIALSAAQYVEAVASQNSGGALNVAANPYFSLVRLA